MALNKSDANILDEIVTLEGRCLNDERCRKCPFRLLCLPEFLNPIPPTQQQRAKMAMDVLTHHTLLDGDSEDISQDFLWDQK